MGRRVSLSRAAVYLSSSVVLLGSIVSTGCQVDIAGQTLPSPYYLTDDVQWYAPGPEFKLMNEAAAMKAYRAEAQLEQ